MFIFNTSFFFFLNFFFLIFNLVNKFIFWQMHPDCRKRGQIKIGNISDKILEDIITLS